MTSNVPDISGIYKITCTSTSKIYVGSAVNLRLRQYEHLRTLRLNEHRNSKLQRAYAKYGDTAFVFEIIEFVLPPFLLEREQYWLDKLQPAFNIARSAQSFHLGLRHSPESLAKMSVNRRGKPAHNLGKRGQKASPETRAKLSQMRIGHSVSPETREKISQANMGKQKNLGRKISPEMRAKISKGHMGNKILVAIAPDGTEYAVHNIREFAREHNLNSSLLTRVAKGKRPIHRDGRLTTSKHQ